MSAHRHEELARFAGAFPIRFAEQVERATAALQIGRYGFSEGDIGDVVVEGERVRIPMRLGATVSERKRASLGLEDRLLLDALMTRHHDGFVRQRHLRSLLAEPRRHLVPFVLQLLGEYVVELIEDIDEGTRGALDEAYEVSLRENSRLLWLTGERVVSYWNCYHRRACPRLQRYVGWQVLTRMRSASRFP